ncbi:MAG: hypothetical protein M0T84_05725 [Betaproteobacteria bacterium]|nr:hypothetical protein [Betaproteobacteria bacterium]
MNVIPTSEENFRDPGYLWGQLMATENLVLRLASLTSTKEDLLENGLESIEMLRNSALSRLMPEAYFAGLDDFEKWLTHVTA